MSRTNIDEAELRENMSEYIMELDQEGGRHFVRNRQEDGFTEETACSILEKVEEYREESNKFMYS